MARAQELTASVLAALGKLTEAADLLGQAMQAPHRPALLPPADRGYGPTRGNRHPG